MQADGRIIGEVGCNAGSEKLMPRNFRELEAKMSPEAQARARALADQYLASAERDAAEADIARWFEKLDEFGPEPFGGENGPQPTPKK
jgi:hypothetical protein